MNRRRLMALLLSLCLLCGLLDACGSSPAEVTASSQNGTAQASAGTDAPPAESVPGSSTAAAGPADSDPAARYARAAAELEQASDYTVKLTVTETRTVGGDTFRETTTRTARFQGMGTEDPVVHIADSMVSGENRTSWEQLWYGGTVWAKLKQTRLCGQKNLEDFLRDQTPAVLLHPENYGRMQWEGEVCTFLEPVAAEPWAMPEGCELLEASGSAVLTDGRISAADYAITFRLGVSELSSVYHADFLPTVDRDLRTLVPESAEGCISLEEPGAALLFYRTWQVLNNSACASLETEGSAAYGPEHRTLLFNQALSNWGRGADLCFRETSENLFLFGTASEETAVAVQNSSVETSLIDGIFTVNRDGTEASENVWDVGWNPERYGNDVLQQLHNREVRLLPTFNNLSGAALEDAGDCWRIEFTANADYGKRLLQAFSGILYDDESRLGSLSSEISVGKVEGWLELEKRTWQPTALSVSLESVCTVGGEAFPVTMNRLTRFRLYDPDTYETITGFPRTDAGEVEPPTPLFYEVTGGNGERLWLLGTVHLGDNRTAALPRVISDAFDSSDALALEIDLLAAGERMKNDGSLRARLAQSQVYSDGTTIADHIDPELYSAAVRILKDSGRYTDGIGQLKPVVWNGFLQTAYWEARGFRLTEAKGVDRRLAFRAKAQRKEIVEAESQDAHIFLLSELPDPIQEGLLRSYLSMTDEAYVAQLEDLYERWCRGDEADLLDCITALNEADRSAIGAKDPAVYEEYRRRMYTDRNAAMLETAENCLHSGKTVFFAVGIGHLFGEDGLVNALQNRGWTVTVVNTGSAPQQAAGAGTP